MTRRLPEILKALAALLRPWLLLPALSGTWTLALLHRALAPAHLHRPLAGELLACGLGAAGLLLSGLVANDWLDRRRDRRLHPERPLASGRLGTGGALLVGSAGLATGLGGAAWLGPASLALAVAIVLAIAFYNTLARATPAAGLLALGTAHAGIVLLAHPAEPILWPALLAGSHVIAAAAIRWRLLERRPSLKPERAWRLALLWAFACFLALVATELSRAAHPPLPLVACLLPALCALAYATLVTWQHTSGRIGNATGEQDPRLTRQPAAWLIAYDAAWLAGTGQWLAAGLALLAAIALGRLGSPPAPRYRLGIPEERAGT